MKKILIISLMILFLTGCFYDKSKTTNTGAVKTMTGRTSTGALIRDPIVERQKENILKNIKNEEEIKIFTDLYTAKDSKDNKKIDELKAKLDVLEKEKREELSIAVKEKNIEKARELQQYLVLFSFEKQ